MVNSVTGWEKLLKYYDKKGFFFILSTSMSNNSKMQDLDGMEFLSLAKVVNFLIDNYNEIINNGDSKNIFVCVWQEIYNDAGVNVYNQIIDEIYINDLVSGNDYDDVEKD